jgi:hypothetical protein
MTIPLVPGTLDDLLPRRGDTRTIPDVTCQGLTPKVLLTPKALLDNTRSAVFVRVGNLLPGLPMGTEPCRNRCGSHFLSHRSDKREVIRLLNRSRLLC